MIERKGMRPSNPAPSTEIGRFWSSTGYHSQEYVSRLHRTLNHFTTYSPYLFVISRFPSSRLPMRVSSVRRLVLSSSGSLSSSPLSAPLSRDSAIDGSLALMSERPETRSLFGRRPQPDETDADVTADDIFFGRPFAGPSGPAGSGVSKLKSRITFA